MLLSWRPISCGTVSCRGISKASLTSCQCLTEVSSLLSSHRTLCPFVWAWWMIADFSLSSRLPWAWCLQWACLSNVDFTAYTWNLVNTRLLVGGSSILVRGEDRLEFGRGTMPHLSIHHARLLLSTTAPMCVGVSVAPAWAHSLPSAESECSRADTSNWIRLPVFHIS